MSFGQRKWQTDITNKIESPKSGNNGFEIHDVVHRSAGAVMLSTKRQSLKTQRQIHEVQRASPGERGVERGEALSLVASVSVVVIDACANCANNSLATRVWM
jgi:hypothetical protein